MALAMAGCAMCCILRVGDYSLQSPPLSWTAGGVTMSIDPVAEPLLLVNVLNTIWCINEIHTRLAMLDRKGLTVPSASLFCKWTSTARSEMSPFPKARGRNACLSNPRLLRTVHGKRWRRLATSPSEKMAMPRFVMTQTQSALLHLSNERRKLFKAFVRLELCHSSTSTVGPLVTRA